VRRSRTPKIGRTRLGDQCGRSATAERLFLNPDCGSGTFSRRRVSSSAGARRKLEAMVGAAREARASLAG
jgi:methionine synthase II (cobalamin-independent)